MMSINNETTTIQLTSKRLKRQLIISYSLIALGFIVFALKGQGTIESNEVGVLSLSFGIIHYTITRVRIWWNHK